MTSTHHTIDYVELGAHDLAASQTFYEQAFGWRFTAYGPSYAGIQSPDGEGEVGGIDATASPRAGGPLVLLYSDDLDASAASIVEAGGTIVREAYSFPGGRRLHFADPGGNELGVWSST
ncbi:MAG: VOC family protein [Aeromicrobium sp.]